MARDPLLNMHSNWTMAEKRARSAEAELAALREVVRAADALRRAQGIERRDWVEVLRYDAIRAKVTLP